MEYGYEDVACAHANAMAVAQFIKEREDFEKILKSRPAITDWGTIVPIAFAVVLLFAFAVQAADNNLLGLDPIDRDLITARAELPRTPSLAPALCDCGCEHEALCNCVDCPNKLHSVVHTNLKLKSTDLVGATSDLVRGRAERVVRNPVPARPIYDSAGSPIVPAPVPDIVDTKKSIIASGLTAEVESKRHDSSMLALNEPTQKLTPLPAVKPVPQQSPTLPPVQTQQPQGYWAQSCNGSTCSRVWIPAVRATTTQTYQPRRRGLFRRW